MSKPTQTDRPDNGNPYEFAMYAHAPNLRLANHGRRTTNASRWDPVVRMIGEMLTSRDNQAAVTVKLAASDRKPKRMQVIRQCIRGRMRTFGLDPRDVSMLMLEDRSGFAVVHRTYARGNA